MESLDVFLCNRLAGSLSRSDRGELSFRYFPEYLASPDAAVISSTLPLSDRPYEERDVAAFFSNLLPDESVRRRIAEILRLSPEDTFGLLRVLGGDCAGAVSFHEAGQTLETHAHDEYLDLTDAEASDLLGDLANRPLGIGENFRGISGAGAQDKLIACVRDGHISLPLHGTPSTHIIKPDIERFPESVFNEWFCMNLSRLCGFDTADCDIITLNGSSYYVTARYDRSNVDGVVTRLHQEDFCQLLKCRPEIKYQDQGGPSLVECVGMLRSLRLPLADLLTFVDRVIFNFIVGNGDAHGKNFSVLYRDQVPRLAPAYDVLCTTVYPAIAKKMAMKVDGKFEFRWMSSGKFVRAFARAGVGEKVVMDSIARQVASVRQALPALSDSANRDHPASVYQEIVSGVHRRIRQLESSIKQSVMV